ncbi:uncharacterized protein [Venturia canescens]|uniref:uncharacterized protein n=1 Tax=Venturia canescens TaxID=32260 RepID=UPI001C9D3F9E|nr:uncharacterized protein LOC122414659 [Venturia canescens]
MFKLLVVATILAVCAGHPAPKPLALSYSGTHLTPVITSYPVYPEVHNYRTFRTFPSSVVSYPGYHTGLLAHQTYSSSFY